MMMIIDEVGRCMTTSGRGSVTRVIISCNGVISVAEFGAYLVLPQPRLDGFVVALMMMMMMITHQPSNKSCLAIILGFWSVLLIAQHLKRNKSRQESGQCC